MRLVRALLALEINLGVASGAGRRLLARAVLGRELFIGPGLDQCAVNGEMLV